MSCNVDGMVPARSGTLTQPETDPTDAALVIAARGGETWAQEALFRRHARLAIGLAHRLLPHDREVDDLVQDCFVQALKRLDTLQNPQAFAAWLGSIVVHAVGKRLRRQRLLGRLGLRQLESIDAQAIAAPTAPADVVVELRRLYGLLASLPPDQRIALVLRRVDRMEIPQIAEYMGLSLSTVKRRLKRAEEELERLR
jgi:RNA polymerase sigma-70 factor (ECF subfamily)